ncbi:MAG TPA: hypothetical protein VHA52_09895 [Candidatus Babeliaceae bacterium]|nr:hypothetical protein [Candidatus Babeliaceae bacterium]
MMNDPYAGLGAIDIPSNDPYEGLEAIDINDAPQHQNKSDIIEHQNKDDAESHQDYSLLERVGQGARGIAGGLADMADFVNQWGAAPILNLAGGATQLAGKGASYLSPEVGAYLEDLAQKAYQARNYYSDSSMGKDLRGVIDEATDNRLQPQDFLGKVFNTAGEFVGPGASLKALKVLKTPMAVQALEGLGAGTAIHSLPELTGNEEIDNFLKGVIGMYGAKKVNPKTEKRLLDFIKGGGWKELDKKIAGKALSLGAKPDEELLKTAKEVGIELPNYLKLNSKIGNVIEKNISPSWLTSPAYKKQQQEAHKAFLNAFDDTVNRIHPEAINLERAGEKAIEGFKISEKDLFQKSEDLYEKAYKTLTENDKGVPINTLEVADKLKKRIDKIPSPSEGDKFLKPKVTALSEKWGLPKDIKESLKEFKETLPAEAYQKIENDILQNAPKVEVPTLTSQRSALLKDLRERSTLKGARKELGELVDSLNKDIEQVGVKNPNFIKGWKEANKFYREEYASTIKSKIGDAILNGESPKEVTKYLNTPHDIDTLSKILKNIPDHSKIMDMLKRSKFQDLVVDKVKTADGSLSYANLANLFSRRSKIDPLLQSLGGQSYENMKKLAKVAQGYVKGGKDVINPSGTAQALANQESVGKAMQTILAVGAGDIAGLKGAATTFLTPWALTKLMSHTPYVEQAVKYALARNNKVKKTALEKMQSIFQNDILKRNVLHSEGEAEEE